MLYRAIDSVRAFDNRGIPCTPQETYSAHPEQRQGHDLRSVSPNPVKAPGGASTATPPLPVVPMRAPLCGYRLPAGERNPPAETLLLPRNRRPPRRRSCRPTLPSGLILPILRACARTGVKIRDPRRHLGQWWNVIQWNTLHRSPRVRACRTSKEIRKLTRLTPHLTRAIHPRNLRRQRQAPNAPE